MAIIRPFRAVRPDKQLVEQIAALPYDVMDTAEARDMVSQNPHSFLRIDRAEINFDSDIDPHDTKVYAKARDILDKMINNEYYLQDDSSYLYIYQQIMDGRKQTGLVCCTSIDDYLHNVIKKHENTRPAKEQDRIDHITVTNAHTGPIFQTYRSQPEIEDTLTQWIHTHAPIYHFASDDGVIHNCWIIDNLAVLDKLVDLFATVPYLYIADGHHRSAAALKVGLNRRKENPNYHGSEEFNHFLSVLFPCDQLQIMSYNRVVQDLAGLTKDAFLTRVSKLFTVKTATESPYQPQEKGTFGMYLENQWYELTPKPGILNEEDPVQRLDVAILQDNLLGPVLNIKDPRTDQRIAFVGGIRGLNELERRVHQGMAVAFSLYPTSIDEVMDVADENQVMPPKSTWFEPKLRSGIYLHLLE